MSNAAQTSPAHEHPTAAGGSDGDLTGHGDVRYIPAADRHEWSNEWLTSWQSFPADANYDLERNAHGLLMVNNEDVVEAGNGFDSHQHRNTEVITWVLEGAVEHRDSRGNHGVIRPGVVQRMTAGTGIVHSERNPATRAERTQTRVVQMWLPPDTDGLAPSYAESDVTQALSSGSLIPVVSGMRRHADDAAITLANRFATLHIAHIPAGSSVEIPAAPFAHVFLASGESTFEGLDQRLHHGDALRLTDAGDRRITAVTDTEVLVWEMHASFDF